MKNVHILPVAENGMLYSNSFTFQVGRKERGGTKGKGKGWEGEGEGGSYLTGVITQLKVHSL